MSDKANTLKNIYIVFFLVDRVGDHNISFFISSFEKYPADIDLKINDWILIEQIEQRVFFFFLNIIWETDLEQSADQCPTRVTGTYKCKGAVCQI